MGTGNRARRRGDCTLTVASAMVGGLLGLLFAAGGVAADDKVFTVAKYPVEAKARNAVAAKRLALADGQRAALRSLLKRLVPVTAYPQLKQLKALKSAAFLDGVAVRSERNSRTEYLASLDFLFRPKAVRDMLRRKGIPFLDRQASAVILVPVYRPPAAAVAGSPEVPVEYSKAEGARLWTEVWKDLDLDHSLTPLHLRPLLPDIHADTITALLGGDDSAFRIITSEYSTDLVVLAVAEPDRGTGRLNVTLIGRDGVDRFSFKHGYRIRDDLPYAAELAAVIGLGIIEGRWKAKMVTTRAGPGISTALAPVRFAVTFRNQGQWRALRTAIARTSGVEQMEIAGLSARGATVSLQIPGGAAQLTQELMAQGLYLRNSGNGLELRGN